MSVPTYDLASLSYDSATTAYDGSSGVPSNMPVVGVFIAFNDTPYVAEPVWTEITQYVRDVNVKRGRQNDLQNFASGSANITLDNRLRIFDPFNTAGIYYGKLLPRRQIKVVAQYNLITYPIFRGYIAGFPVGYTQGGKDSTVEIDCFDALGLLGSEAMTDYLDIYTRSLTPYAYWKCGDSLDQFLQDTTGKIYYQSERIRDLKLLVGTYNIPFTNVDSFLDSLHAQATNFERASSSSMDRLQNYASNPLPVTSVVGDVSFAGWIQIEPARFTSMELTINAVQSSNTQVWSIYLNGLSGGQIKLSAGSPTLNTTLCQTSSSDLSLGTPMHVAATYSYTTGEGRIYINGADVTTAQLYQANQRMGIPNGLSVAGLKAQEMSVYQRVLTAAEISELYKLGLLRPSETSSARVTRIMAQSSFPLALQSITGSPVATVGDIPFGVNTLNELEQASRSEFGALYASKSNVLVFTNRDYFASSQSAISQMTFTDTGTGVYYDYASLRMGYDADLIRNKVQVTYSGDTSLQISDATSVSVYGESGETFDTNLDTSAGATSSGNQFVTIYKNPKLKVEPFTVKGQRNPTYDWQRLLALELLDRFTFVRTPSVGSAISQDMLLQSIEYKITPNTWETVVNGSARFTGWFTIGTSLIGGTDVLL
jgi:hypothetical protein